MGVYPLSWVFHTLYHHQDIPREPPVVQSFMTKYASTGADKAVSTILNFPKSNAHGIALTSIRVSTVPGESGKAGPAVRIQGTKGEIQVSHPAVRPEHFRILMKEGGVEDVHMPIKTRRGLFFEADEAARCIRDGKKESARVSLEDTVVLWKTSGLQFSADMESTEYGRR